jgi:hypothetical protein
VYIPLLVLLSVTVVSFVFWLITGELHIIAPILGAMIVVILSIKNSKN